MNSLIRKNTLWLLTCLLLLASHTSSAQSNLGNLELGAEYFGGKTYLHSPDMRFVIPDRPWGISAEAMFQTQGNRYWHEMYGNPRIGLQVVFKSFGNDSILGHAIGLVPLIDLPVLRTQIGNCWFRFGFGADFITKPYDRITNYNNNAIGTYLNNMTYLGFIWETPLSSKWRVRLGATFTHTSNGAVIMPNLGLNTADWRIGLVYKQDPTAEKQTVSYQKTPLERKVIWNLRFGVGAEQFKVPDGPTYPVYIVSVFASHQIGRGSKLNLGLEWNYYPANHAFNLNLGIPPEDITAQFKASRVSVNMGHELMFGQVGFLVSLFMYVDHPFEGDGWYGNKLGPVFYLKKPHEKGRRRNVFIAGMMKSHGFVADYIEAVIGYSF